MSIYSIHHGQTNWNIAGKMQGNTDIPSNETDRRQAQYLADGMKSRSVVRISSSALGRTLETAGAVGATQQVAAEPVDGLEGVGFGQWEGMSWDKIMAQYPGGCRHWCPNPVEVSPPGGEFQGEVWLRCEKAMNTILSKAAETKGDVTVVSRGAILAYIIQHLMREHPLEKELTTHNASTTTVTYSPLTDDLIFVDMNNTEHLH